MQMGHRLVLGERGELVQDLVSVSGHAAGDRLKNFLRGCWDTQIFLMYLRVGIISGAIGSYYLFTRWVLGTLDAIR